MHGYDTWRRPMQRTSSFHSGIRPVTRMLSPLEHLASLQRRTLTNTHISWSFILCLIALRVVFRFVMILSTYRALYVILPHVQVCLLCGRQTQAQDEARGAD